MIFSLILTCPEARLNESLSPLHFFAVLINRETQSRIMSASPRLSYRYRFFAILMSANCHKFRDLSRRRNFIRSIFISPVYTRILRARLYGFRTFVFSFQLPRATCHAKCIEVHGSYDAVIHQSRLMDASLRYPRRYSRDRLNWKAGRATHRSLLRFHCKRTANGSARRMARSAHK